MGRQTRTIVYGRVIPGLVVAVVLGLLISEWLGQLGPAASAQGGPALSVVPASSTGTSGATIEVDVVAQNVPSVSTYEFDLFFNTGAVVTIAGSTTTCIGGLFPVMTPTIGSSPYTIRCRGLLPGQGVPGPNVTLAHVVFQCVSNGSSALDLQNAYLVNSSGVPISPLAVNDGQVNCQPPTPTSTPTTPATATPTPTSTPTPGPSSPWADVVPFKEATPSPAESAEVVTYTAIARNMGLMSALNVMLWDRVPPEATLLGFDPRCTFFMGGLVCGPVDLVPYDWAPGGYDEVQYVFTVRAPATSVDVDLVDIVTVSADTEPMQNTGNNATTLITKVVACPDVDGSGVVDLFDVFAIGESYGARRGEPGYVSGRDVNQDGVIDVLDVLRVGAMWGATCP